MLTVQLRLDLHKIFISKKPFTMRTFLDEKKILSNLNGMLTKDLIFLILSDLTLSCGG